MGGSKKKKKDTVKTEEETKREEEKKTLDPVDVFVNRCIALISRREYKEKKDSEFPAGFGKAKKDPFITHFVLNDDAYRHHLFENMIYAESRNIYNNKFHGHDTEQWLKKSAFKRFLICIKLFTTRLVKGKVSIFDINPLNYRRFADLYEYFSKPFFAILDIGIKLGFLRSLSTKIKELFDFFFPEGVWKKHKLNAANISIAIGVVMIGVGIFYELYKFLLKFRQEHYDAHIKKYEKRLKKEAELILDKCEKTESAGEIDKELEGAVDDIMTLIQSNRGILFNLEKMLRSQDDGNEEDRKAIKEAMEKIALILYSKKSEESTKNSKEVEKTEEEDASKKEKISEIEQKPVKKISKISDMCIRALGSIIITDIDVIKNKTKNPLRKEKIEPTKVKIFLQDFKTKLKKLEEVARQ